MTRFVCVLMSVGILGLTGGCENLFVDTSDIRLGPISDADIPDSRAADADDNPRDADGSAVDTPGLVDTPGPVDTTDDGLTDGGDGGPPPPDGGYRFGVCDPVAETCPAGQYCKLLLEGQERPRLVTVCGDAANSGQVQPGRACTSADDCVRTSYCVNWSKPDRRGKQCSRYCLLDSGQGCASDEFCVNPFDILDGIGFCTKRCDPYSPTCPDGARCQPRGANTAAQVTTPSFQCLAVDDNFSAKQVGSDCDLEHVNLDGCSAGLVCYPVEGRDTCVQPCDSGDDCGTTCGSPAGGWGLKYCSLPMGGG